MYVKDITDYLFDSEYRNAPKASEILIPVEDESKLLERQIKMEASMFV